MRHSTPRPLLCDRTREWVALRLDTDLSEFETALMRGHLERCAECRAFADEVAAVTFVLRAEPLETPARPISVPAPPRFGATRRLSLVAAAAAVLVAAGLGGLYGTLGSSPSSGTAVQPVHAPMLADAAPDAFLRNLRLLSLRHSASRSIGAAKPVLRATA